MLILDMKVVEMIVLDVAQNKSRVDLLVVKLLRDTGVAATISTDSMEFRVAVQKFVYLLQVVGGLDLGFKFEWLSMGPYSRGLQNHYQRISRTLVSNADSVAEFNDVEQSALDAVKRLLSSLEKSVARLDVKVLEIAASLIMLCRDVYPKPLDPVEELMMRKNLPREDVVRIWSAIDKLSICR
ncbi:MAG: hypothetical protein N3D82_03135 [Ignisphaera sp.]|nr:hypothetical protein [Ignisphaera sp.]MCX8168004.1 hypothetical protein [Ignisphaera sp.]